VSTEGSDTVLSFQLLPILVVVLFLALQLLHWSRRQKKLRAFIAKYGLHDGQGMYAIVDPGIRGWLWPAGYPLWLEGWLGDVRVVAFDYQIGFGRNKQRGSGVGVKRRIEDLRPLAPGMKATRNGEWTFLVTRIPLFLNTRTLDPDDMEKLWFELLRAAASESDGPPTAMLSRPGEIHIRPRRRTLSEAAGNKPSGPDSSANHSVVHIG